MEPGPDKENDSKHQQRLQLTSVSTRSMVRLLKQEIAMHQVEKSDAEES